MSQVIENFSIILDQAAKNASPVPQLSFNSKFTLRQAYKIQEASLNKRYSRGENLTGLKMGFTSIAKMKQMGVHDMIWGRLTDAMEVLHDDVLDLDKFIHPRAEPEIAFLLKKDIVEPISIDNVGKYLGAVSAAIEIIDSRYKNFKFTLEDVIADNCSSSGYIIGKWCSPNFNVLNIPITISANGKLKEEGNSEAILENPIHSLVEATRLALKYGQPLKKGMIILAGAATAAIKINKGDTIQATFGELGSLSFRAK